MITEKQYLEYLIKQYQNLIYSICLKSVGNPFDAEDLTQEVFLSAYKKMLERKEDLTGVVPASDAIDTAKEYRDTHIRQFLLEAEDLLSFRERLVSITQKYLCCERERVLEGKR